MQGRDVLLVILIFVAGLLSYGLATIDFSSGREKPSSETVELASADESDQRTMQIQQMLTQQQARIQGQRNQPQTAPTPVKPTGGYSWETALEFKDAANRHITSPWHNQPAFGYRKWFVEPEYLVSINGRAFSIPLDPNGNVISLPPHNWVYLKWPEPVEADGLVFLCSAYFIYDKSLEFKVRIRDDSRRIRDVTLKTYDWFVEYPPREANPKSVPIRVDGRNNAGWIYAIAADYQGQLAEMAIKNTQAENNQNLMIAGIGIRSASE